MKHKVVACIPTKNTGWLLKDTIRQLSSFCEKIIISDDNSTDDTYDICSKYKTVEYHRREPRENGDRQGALQRQELLSAAYKHDPDYFLFLDADEMPSPDIVEWINSLETRHKEKNNLWTFPWVHLWGDEKHYRVDSYTSRTGSNIHWDPFTTTYRKGFFVRNIPNYELKYDIKQHRVRPSNQPVNVPKPWINVEKNPVIIHYGKISEYFTSGQNWMDRALWDNYEKGSPVQQTLMHHKISNLEETLELKQIDPRWVWDDI
jgi:glycosyltransferase involved in cell wall biosynthesis|tara:strand:+ start:4300 stop:5082 length:783 start_codon:yes stop_codon:yes gene_type:complete